MKKILTVTVVTVLVAITFLLADEPYTAPQSVYSTPQKIQVTQLMWDRRGATNFFIRFHVISNGVPIGFLWSDPQGTETNWVKSARFRINRAEYRAGLTAIGVANPNTFLSQMNRGFEWAIKQKMPIQ